MALKNLSEIKLKSMTAIVLVFFIIALSGCIGDSEYIVRVSGTEGIAFSGSYMTVTAGGTSTSNSVDGITPMEYAIKGNIVSVVFQKKHETGVLRVEILRGNKVVAQSETSAAYGVVSAATGE